MFLPLHRRWGDPLQCRSTHGSHLNVRVTVSSLTPEGSEGMPDGHASAYHASAFATICNILVTDQEVVFDDGGVVPIILEYV